MSDDEEEESNCAEQYEHGCEDCPDYDCPYRDLEWQDPTDDSQGTSVKKTESQKQ